MAEYHSTRYWLPGYDDPDDLRTTTVHAFVPERFEFIANGKKIANAPPSIYIDSGLYIPFNIIIRNMENQPEIHQKQECKQMGKDMEA